MKAGTLRHQGRLAISRLARGVPGMGEVYRARDSRLNRDVAVKAVRPAVINDVDRVSSLTITAAGGKEMTFAMHAAMVSVTSKAAGAKK